MQPIKMSLISYKKIIRPNRGLVKNITVNSIVYLRGINANDERIFRWSDAQQNCLAPL